MTISGDNMSLTKSDIAEDLTKKGFSRKQSLEILETLVGIIKRNLASGEDVLISGFGKFCVKEKKQRRGRNPATGDDLILGARRVVTFNCSSVLRNKFNG